MPKDINPAEIMLNNLTEKSESLTGHNPLDIRRLSTYFIFDFTENPEVNERLKLRVSTDHVKKNLNDIDQIFFLLEQKSILASLQTIQAQQSKSFKNSQKEENNFALKMGSIFPAFVP